MVSSHRFDRFNRSRRRQLNRSNPEQALSRAVANALAGIRPAAVGEKRSKQTRRVDAGQILQSRLLLSSVTIDLSSWTGVNLLLEASGNSNNGLS